MNLFGLISTVFYFKTAQKTKNIPVLNKFPPILLAGIALILTLELFNIDFDTYNESAMFLTYLLIPSTIALGYPVYKNIELLKKNKRIIYTAFILATILAIISTYIFVLGARLLIVTFCPLNEYSELLNSTESTYTDTIDEISA